MNHEDRDVRAARTLTRHLAPTHQYLRRRWRAYDTWHGQPHAHHTHWLLLVLVILLHVMFIQRMALQAAGCLQGCGGGVGLNPPSLATITSPNSGSAYRAETLPVSITGSAADDALGLGLAADSVTYMLAREADGTYWTGATWALETNLSTTHGATIGAEVANWQASLTGFTLVDGRYTARATVTNQAGLSLTSTPASFIVDRTPPQPPTGLVDGADATDDETSLSTTTLSATWNQAIDSVSGISGYKLAIGTTPGDGDVSAWRSVGVATSATVADLQLTVGARYYVSVRAVDQAGNESAVVSTNGLLIENPPAATPAPSPSVSASSPVPTPSPSPTASPQASVNPTATSSALSASADPEPTASALAQAVSPAAPEVTAAAEELVRPERSQADVQPPPPPIEATTTQTEPRLGSVLGLAAVSSPPGILTAVAGQQTVGEGLAGLFAVRRFPAIQTFETVIYFLTAAVLSIGLVLPPLLKTPLLFPIDRLRAWLFPPLWRRRRQVWGRVYDAESTASVPLARVEVIDAKTSRLVETQMTNWHGEFAAPTKPGRYRLTVFKDGFLFPSSLLVVDYHGETVTISAKRTPQFLIPIDPDAHRLHPQLLVVLFGLELVRIIRRPLLFVGSLLAIVAFLDGARLVAGLIAASYGLAWTEIGLEHWFRRTLSGRVVDRRTGRPLSLALIRWLNQETGSIDSTTVTNRAGAFRVILTPGYYRVRISHLGFQWLQTDDLMAAGGGREAREYFLTPLRIKAEGGGR